MAWDREQIRQVPPIHGAYTLGVGYRGQNNNYGGGAKEKNKAEERIKKGICVVVLTLGAHNFM